MNKNIVQPILWTIISAVAVVLVFFADNNDTIWAVVFVIVAIACAVLQWMVYSKKKSGTLPKQNSGKRLK